MTKREFILRAMLHLAGTGQYKDQFENKRLVTKEARISADAEALADEAERRLEDPFDQPDEKPSCSNNEYLGNVSGLLEEIKDVLCQINEALEDMEN